MMLYSVPKIIYDGNNFPWRWGAHSHSPRSLQEWQVTQMGYATALGAEGVAAGDLFNTQAFSTSFAQRPEGISERSCKESGYLS